jgi:hypothetical protein
MLINPPVPYAVHDTPAVSVTSPNDIPGMQDGALRFNSYFELLFSTQSYSFGTKLKRKLQAIILYIRFPTLNFLQYLYDI